VGLETDWSRHDCGSGSSQRALQRRL
jgi:hypothetical protein